MAGKFSAEMPADISGQFLKDLQSIPADSELYDVYGLDKPVEIGG